MELNEYQIKAKEFALPVSPLERVFGLIEESGEVAGVFKRLERGDYDMTEFGNRLVKELGDVLWYMAAICTDNGWTLEDIAKENIDKLTSRKLRNAILGEGDNR